MASNRLGFVDDDNWWNETKTKGFDFGDDTEIEDDIKFFGGNRDVATKINQELRAEISSLQSFTSDASSDEPHEFSQRVRDLPSFLWGDASTNVDGESDRPVTGAQDLLKQLNLGFDEHHDRYHAPHVDETIHQFLIGGEVSLEAYKSLSQKKALLAKAIDVADGNAILTVTLFLFKSLKPSLFRQLLLENRSAADHYIRYLEIKSEVSHLIDLLNMLGRTRDALILRYKQILRKEGNFQNFLKELDHFHKAECQLSDEDISTLINQHLQLLGIHREIREKKGTSFSHVEFQSILKTLKYIAEHFYESTTAPLSVESVKTKYNLNVKQYAWVVLQSLVKEQKWPQIETLLLTKTWLGSSKDKCLLPLEDVCNSLKGAPVDLTARFVRLIDDSNKKLALAKKHKCHMVVIEVYGTQKDRAAILSYKSNLEEQSKEAIYAENVLKNSTIKWKN